MSQNSKRVAAAVEVVQRFVPAFRIFPKTKSRLHRLIGWLVGRAYLANFWTTFGYTACWPSCYDEDFDSNAWACILHEGLHAQDASRLTRLLFSFLYAIPQALAPLVAVSAIWGPWWLLLCALPLLGPLPALFRLHAESRAYSLEAATFWWWRQDADQLVRFQNDAVNYLTGGSYYWTLPWRSKVARLIEKDTTRLIAGQSLNQYEQACRTLALRFRAEDFPIG